MLYRRNLKNGDKTERFYCSHMKSKYHYERVIPTVTNPTLIPIIFIYTLQAESE